MVAVELGAATGPPLAAVTAAIARGSVLRTDVRGWWLGLVITGRGRGGAGAAGGEAFVDDGAQDAQAVARRCPAQAATPSR